LNIYYQLVAVSNTSVWTLCLSITLSPLVAICTAHVDNA